MSTRGRGAGGGGRLVRDLAFVDAEHLLVLSTPSHDSSNGQVVLWKLPRPNGKAMVTRSLLVRMNQRIRPRTIATATSRR